MNRLIIKQISKEFLNFRNTGISFLETSHRSKVFSEFFEETNNTIKNYLNMPEEFKVAWIQNEREFQYDMIYLNYKSKEKPVYFLNEGKYSNKAIKICNNDYLKYEKNKDYTNSPYVFYVSDEGDDGFYNDLSNYKGNNLISDMSDDFLTKKINFDQHKLIFSSTLPHLGPNGIVLCLINEKYIEKNNKNKIPVLADYENYIKNNSLYQTPSTHCIYFASKTFEFLSKYGINKEELIKIHKFKAEKIYNELEKNKNIEVNNMNNRSNSSILFKVNNDNNKNFIEKSFKKGIYLEEMENKYLKFTNSIGRTEEDISDFLSILN